MSPTIRDVAKLAGVSVGTVSNVLNGVATVSPKNQERVAWAIASLGYRRNQMASQLRSNISRSIGLVIPDITNPFYPEVARGVEDYASGQGFNVFLCNKDRNAQKEQAAVDALLSKNVDGILLYKSRLLTPQIEEIRSHCALVMIDADQKDFDCDIINVEDYDGMVGAVRTAIELGHRRIAFIAGLSDSFSSMRRLHAYRDSLSLAGLHCPSQYVYPGDFTLTSGIRAAQQFMSLSEPPTAVLAANDMMAIGAMRWALENGVAVPQQLSVVGYDDVMNAQLVLPALTTVSQPKYELGLESARMLFRRIEATRAGRILDRQTLAIPTQLRMRESLAKKE